MENANKQICRLCFELILDGDYEVIEESKKKILDILLIKIDFEISDNAVACKECLAKLRCCYDFKLNCFYMIDYVTPFVDGDVKVDMKNVSEKVTITSDNINLDNSQKCRLCMSFIEDEVFNCYTSDLKDMIGNCLPEVNLNSIDEPLVCKPCLSNITRYYEFMKICEEVEQKIKNHGIASKVILEDVLELEKCGTLSKSLEKQYLDPENETKCHKNEEAANIKCEEIDIKDEFDIGVEMSETVKLGNDDSSEKNGSLKKTDVRTSNAKGKTFCPKFSCSENKRYRLRNHMQTHLNNKVYTCTLCSFVTDSRLSLKAHLTKVHRGPTKAFGCHECPYETECKQYLNQHLLKHKDKSEVEMHKCLLCSFESKYKSALAQHRKLKHKKSKRREPPEKNPKHKCEKCDFQTSCKRILVEHMRTHENKFSCDQCTYSTYLKGYLHRHKSAHHKNDIRQMYKCKLCDYQARTRSSINNHMKKTHMDPSKVPTFKCALCPYESPIKDYLSKHITRWHHHKDQLAFQCTLCPYVTKGKENLRNHSRIKHKLFCIIKCDQCDFRTKQKENLQQHMKLHESAKLPIFKCDKCEYSTLQKSNLKQHKVTHMELGQAVAYKCKLCDYQAKIYRSLKNHMTIFHMDPSKVPKFKCALCPYEGTAKRYLFQHIKRWHNHKEQLAFECTLCPYVTNRQENLRKHSRMKHKLFSTIKCDQCDFRTKQKENLQQHMKLHESAKLPLFKCDKCEYSTLQKSNLKQHKVTHMELGQAKVYKCKLCDYQAKTRRSVKYHMITIHMDPSKVPTFKCALCPYESTLKGYLTGHIARRHKHKEQLA